MVEADRGEDLGFVAERLNNSTDKSLAEKVESNKILRVATDEEVGALPAKLIEENKALLFIRDKVKTLKCDMEVLDAEFQFDCHKLTIYYTSDRRIDFRELVSTLFAQFKTRIWMQRTNFQKTNKYVKTAKHVEPSVEVFSSTEFRRLGRVASREKVVSHRSPTITCRKEQQSWRQNQQRSRASSYDTHPTLSTVTEFDHEYDGYDNDDDDDDDDDATIASGALNIDFSSLAQVSIETHTDDAPSKLLSAFRTVPPTAPLPSSSLSPFEQTTTAPTIHNDALASDGLKRELQPAGVLYLDDDIVDRYFENLNDENEADPMNTPVELQDFDFDDVFNSDYDYFTKWSTEILNGH